MSTERNKAEDGATGEDFMSKEEIEQLIKTLSAMKIKPKADTPADLLGWMSKLVDVGKETGAIPKTPIKTEPFSPSFFKETTDATTSYKQPVRIALFSGGTSDSAYELWRYEVTCLRKEGYSKETILNAIRRSLKGEPATVMMRLGPVDSIDEILQKFDSIYGNVLGTEDILAEFYSAKQKDTEDCATWSIRLEDLINRAITKGKVSTIEAKEMLRTMFYKGLRQDLRDISGHLFHTVLDFDQLRIAVRKLESEHQPAPKSRQATVKAACVPDERFDTIQAQLTQLSDQVVMMNQHYSMNQAPQQRGYVPRQNYQRGRGAPRGRGWNRPSRPMPAYSESRDDVTHQPQQPNNITCYRCGQEGHIAVGCRVRTDHRRGHLNFSRPNPGVKDLAQQRNGPSTKTN